MIEALSIVGLHTGTDIDADQQEVLRLEVERSTALISGDFERLSCLMADDLVHIHGNGQVEGKAEYLEGVRQKYRFHSVDRRDLKIRTYGPAVVITGPILQRFSIAGVDGELEAEGLLTQIWVRADTDWQQNTYHMQFLKLNGKPVL